MSGPSERSAHAVIASAWTQAVGGFWACRRIRSRCGRSERRVSACACASVSLEGPSNTLALDRAFGFGHLVCSSATYHGRFGTISLRGGCVPAMAFLVGQRLICMVRQKARVIPVQERRRRPFGPLRSTDGPSTDNHRHPPQCALNRSRYGFCAMPAVAPAPASEPDLDSWTCPKL